MSVITGNLGVMMPTGRVMDDNGELHTSVQDAEDAASSFIWIGPGTFNEAVTIDTAGLMVLGSGRGTLIDGGTTGDAISIEAANVLIQNLSVQTTAGGGNSFDGITTGGGGDSGVISNVWVRDSDNVGISIGNGNDWQVTSCIVESADGTGIQSTINRLIISKCIILGVNDSGIAPNSHDAITAFCIVRNASGFGIAQGDDNGIVIGHRVIGAGDDGIRTSTDTTDSIVANNRVSGSTNSDIDDQGTGTVLSANRTGAAN